MFGLFKKDYVKTTFKSPKVTYSILEKYKAGHQPIDNHVCKIQTAPNQNSYAFPVGINKNPITFFF